MISIHAGLILLNVTILFYFSKISNYLNFFDFPDNDRKIHQNPISLLGGFIIYSNLIMIFLIDLASKENLFPFKGPDNYTFVFISTLVFLLGYIDDKYSLSANKKLLILSLLILILIFFDNNLLLSELRFSFTSKTYNLGFFSYFFTLLCILLFVNAFNMFDGINLQCGIYALLIFIILKLNYLDIVLFNALIVSILVFLYLNFKNKCFLGNNGSHLIAFIISYFFIKGYNTGVEFKADSIFIFMMIPGFELLRLAVARVINKKHPFEADKNHLHHVLIAKFSFYKTTIIQQSLILLPILFSFIIINNLLIILITLLIYASLIIRFRN